MKVCAPPLFLHYPGLPSCLSAPARDYHLAVPGSFKSFGQIFAQLECVCYSGLLTDVSKWCDVMKTLQHYVTITSNCSICI